MNPFLSDKPRLLKASHCPEGTAKIPPLITSAINALENILNPNINAETRKKILSQINLYLELRNLLYFLDK